jgi:hypothetical protein
MAIMAEGGMSSKDIVEVSASTIERVSVKGLLSEPKLGVAEVADDGNMVMDSTTADGVVE